MHSNNLFYLFKLGLYILSNEMQFWYLGLSGHLIKRLAVTINYSVILNQLRKRLQTLEKDKSGMIYFLHDLDVAPIVKVVEYQHLNTKLLSRNNTS